MIWVNPGIVNTVVNTHSFFATPQVIRDLFRSIDGTSQCLAAPESHSFESILMVLMVLMVPFIDGLPIKNGGFPWFPAC